MNATKTNQEIIETHLEAWNNAEGAHLNAATGFAAWVWDVMQETRTALADGELEQLANDLAYSVAQGDDAVTEEQAMEWLRGNRTQLIEAIDAELEDQ